jgi:hypothetical protein
MLLHYNLILRGLLPGFNADWFFGPHNVWSKPLSEPVLAYDISDHGVNRELAAALLGRSSEVWGNHASQFCQQAMSAIR